ncbi:MAG: hypothetical protein B6D56_01690 [Candidatus Omnitrophica bacterium 4484_70.1]|nr:MAG: hypothetical protein B6D56_01690 [Candidatus Omnitrophica bacterium 4484_70.1]
MGNDLLNGIIFLMRERRRFVRLDINVKVRWKRIEQVNEEEKEVTKNISGGGICLIAEEKLNKGDTLYLEIELPSGELIYARGRVVWVNEYEIIGVEVKKKYDVGIEFIEIKEEDREEIGRYIFTLLHEKDRYQKN